MGSDEAADEDFNNQLISIQQQLHVEEVVRNSDAKGEQCPTLYRLSMAHGQAYWVNKTGIGNCQSCVGAAYLLFCFRPSCHESWGPERSHPVIFLFLIS